MANIYSGVRLTHPAIFWLDELSQISPILRHILQFFIGIWQKKNRQNLPKNRGLMSCSIVFSLGFSSEFLNTKR